MNIRKTITPLFWRVIVFASIFVVASGIIGPKIIQGGILFRDGFEVYGGIGKALLFSLVAFLFLVRHKKAQLTLLPWRPLLLGWMLASLLSFALAWVTIHNLLTGDRTLYNLVLSHGGLWLGLAFAAIGCIGPKNIKRLCQAYKREILASSALGVSFYLFLQIVYMLWHPLASVVLVSVSGLLAISGLEATIVPPHTLMFDKFGITVAEFCSGVESIALFTGLYVVVGLLDWQRLDKSRYFLVFPFALLLLFAFNILRVYGLIMAGYYINAEIAFSLFHSYAGMVFFILYSALFWTIAYKYLLKRNRHENPTSH